jgi:hypothetical protein
LNAITAKRYSRPLHRSGCIDAKRVIWLLILVVFGFGRAMRFVETWLTRFSEFLMLDKTLGPHLCCRYQFSFQSAGPRAYCLGTQSFCTGQRIRCLWFTAIPTGQAGLAQFKARHLNDLMCEEER